MSTDPIEKRLKHHEKTLNDALKLIITQYLANEITFHEAYGAGESLIKGTVERVVKEANAEAEALGLPRVSPEEIDALIEQLSKDFLNEMSMMPLDPDDALLRVGLTAWAVVWVPYNTVIIESAKAAGVSHLRWVTSKFEPWKTCQICKANEGIHRIEEFPTYPAHLRCRCYVEVPVLSERAWLDSMFIRSMARLKGLS